MTDFSRSYPTKNSTVASRKTTWIVIHNAVRPTQFARGSANISKLHRFSSCVLRATVTRIEQRLFAGRWHAGSDRVPVLTSRSRHIPYAVAVIICAWISPLSVPFPTTKRSASARQPVQVGLCCGLAIDKDWKLLGMSLGSCSCEQDNGAGTRANLNELCVGIRALRVRWVWETRSLIWKKINTATARVHKLNCPSLSKQNVTCCSV